MTGLRLALLVSALVVSFGCNAKYPYVDAPDLPPTDIPVDSLPLRSGDRVLLTIPGLESELAGSAEQTVTADGNVMIPVVGPLAVAGQTPGQAKKQLASRLNGIVRDPSQARITVIDPRSPRVVVLGEVNRPGRAEISFGEGVLQAIALTGGLTEFANPGKIYVIREAPLGSGGADGGPVRIRFEYDDLVGAEPRSLQFRLQDGDVIVVQ